MNIQERHESFAGCKTLDKAVDIVKSGEVGHRRYSFYSTLDRVQSMLTGKFPSIWLTRLDSELFDDLLECPKYGSKAKKRQSRTFIKCFTYEGRENAAMWGLYCPPTYKAIRVTVSNKAMECLRKSSCFKVTARGLTKEQISVPIDFTDVVYAAVKSDDEAEDRSNNLYWDGVYTQKITDLCKKRKNALAVGTVKDIEWYFEKESRLIVQTKKSLKSDHVAISLPHEFIDSMSFTLSPWANEAESLLVRNSLSKCLRAAGRKNATAENDEIFKTSALKGAFRRWAEQRGLS